jgi:transcriptional regulator with XRE-family HTH domain
MHTRIKTRRQQLGLSQEELAEHAQLSQSQFSKIERGEVTRPSYKRLLRIAEALGCSVEDITDDVEPSVPTAFQSFVNPAAVFIPLYSEKQPMNKEFNHGDGFIIRPNAATQQQIRKPSFLEYSQTAYAITTYSETMSPRYKPGDVLFIDPKLIPQPGDDVVLMFHLEDRLVGMVRECAAPDPNGTITVLDLKSNKKINFMTTDLYAVHVIVGSQRHRG